MNLGDSLTISAAQNIQAGNGGISLYPNPANGGDVNVRFSNIEPGTYQVTLYNASGQKELAQAVPYTGGVFTQKLPAGNLTPGTYEVAVDKNNSLYKSFKLTIK